MLMLLNVNLWNKCAIQKTKYSVCRVVKNNKKTRQLVDATLY